mmetsp:Transcript_4954/g.8597  ORF Transcript_4954/g.8597 Transcript_4954/m.8597 type:complete len:381 (-) Transcript_4954:219-1361(-)|eukprot:CAMPEP_0182444936 /NCGR_PEP_ID=MMETSP1172-20130603/3233_1 /TAXON_ID=708627 /ORGANISM="Timspurckia oligopyrenoides, Strain CCMP3278" /LENGTH=380 /DNA_ID=CAMNT_0024640609 /DNA_START=125 /DNA_END=1267 /DNA_ORIENTATION=-
MNSGNNGYSNYNFSSGRNAVENLDELLDSVMQNGSGMIDDFQFQSVYNNNNNNDVTNYRDMSQVNNPSETIVKVERAQLPPHPRFTVPGNHSNSSYSPRTNPRRQTSNSTYTRSNLAPADFQPSMHHGGATTHTALPSDTLSTSPLFSVEPSNENTAFGSGKDEKAAFSFEEFQFLEKVLAEPAVEFSQSDFQLSQEMERMPSFSALMLDELVNDNDNSRELGTSENPDAEGTSGYSWSAEGNEVEPTSDTFVKGREWSLEQNEAENNMKRANNSNVKAGGKVEASVTCNALVSPRQMSISQASVDDERRSKTWLAVRRSREKKKSEALRLEARYAALQSENEMLKKYSTSIQAYVDSLQNSIIASRNTGFEMDPNHAFQ